MMGCFVKIKLENIIWYSQTIWFEHYSDTLNINIENKTLAISSTKNRSSSRGIYEKNEHIFGWLVRKLLKHFS